MKMVKEKLKILKSAAEIDTSGASLASFSRTPKVIADHTKTLKSCKRKEAPRQSSTLERAEKIKASLNPKFPILVKYMLPSHVSSCFWLGLPPEFCRSYLPKHDEMITLITEIGEEHPVKFLAHKTGFSGGWRAFSILNKLVEGDVVIFHLIEDTKFKVYLVRNSKLAEVDASITLLNLNALGGSTDSGKIGKTKISQRKRLKYLPVSIVQENYRSTSSSVSELDIALPLQKAGNDSEEIELDCDGKGSIKFAESIVDFKDIRDVEGFTILVNGLVIDSQIPTFVKNKYYGLCCSQHAFLHEYLPKVINCKLVAGMISETVNIGDAIAASKLTTSQKDFLIWDKSLDAFEQLGMNVGFLRSRLRRLMKLASKQNADSKRYGEALLEQSQVKEEIKNIELKLSQLREASERVAKEIETLKEKSVRHELKFLAEASAPW